MAKKRTLDTFFLKPSSPAKKPRTTDPTTDVADDGADASSATPSSHHTYPFPVAQLPPSLEEGLGFVPADDPRAINNQPDLDLLYFSPYISPKLSKDLFRFLRSSLFFYRVMYKIKRGSVETQINTPRFTTVFGVDQTSSFSYEPEDKDAAPRLVDAATRQLLPTSAYHRQPRPLPACLERLRKLTEQATSETFNFCLVNYYATGQDSISYHSDDERFLGKDPAIASLSLGAERDFLMRHKPPAEQKTPGKDAKGAGGGLKDQPSLKLPLASGDMVLMRGRTQSCWLHSIPKRANVGGKGASGAEQGRINITFRRAMVKGGTENYYQYNVGEGTPVYVWDESKGEMVVWNG